MNEFELFKTIALLAFGFLLGWLLQDYENKTRAEKK